MPLPSFSPELLHFLFHQEPPSMALMPQGRECLKLQQSASGPRERDGSQVVEGPERLVRR